MLKVRASITEKDPSFKVKYIGCIETFVATGKGCTNTPVQKIWDNCAPERTLDKIHIVINTSGILFMDTDKKGKISKVFSIENISFCNADNEANNRIFSWICKDEASPSLICHAVLCSSKEKAKAMTLVLSRAFQVAYKEWKMEKVKEQRDSHKEKTKAIEAAAHGSYPKKYPALAQNKEPEPEVENISEQKEYDNQSISASSGSSSSKSSESKKLEVKDSDTSVEADVKDQSKDCDELSPTFEKIDIQATEKDNFSNSSNYVNSF